MGKLVHLLNATLDRIIKNEQGSVDRGAPSDELFVHLDNPIRPLGTHLNRRRLHETIAPCETGPKLVVQSDLTAGFTGIETAASRGTSR